MNNIVYTRNIHSFSEISGFPISYWATKNIIKCFKLGKSLNSIFDVKKGADTGNNSSFLRLWFEINKFDFNAFNNKTDKWVAYTKGGDFRKWYGNNTNVIYWLNNGQKIRKSKANLRSPQLYFKETITWSALTSGSSSFRDNKALGLFDSAGSSMLPPFELFYIVLGVLNTKIADALFEVLNPTLNNGAGTVGLFPLITIKNNNLIQHLSTQNVLISKQDWDSFETSWDFKKHPLI